MNNEYIYLSNLLWEKATATSLFPKKDLSSMEYPLSLYLNNELVTYNKGLGMHANSEIIFDIKNLNCSKFEYSNSTSASYPFSCSIICTVS